VSPSGGGLTVATEDDEGTLERFDSVWLDAWEAHRVENTGDERAVGLDVFAPGRSFDFWTDREEA
jgi:quercetin dioxygenase-like cupin family protein